MYEREAARALDLTASFDAEEPSMVVLPTSPYFFSIFLIVSNPQ